MNSDHLGSSKGTAENLAEAAELTGIDLDVAVAVAEGHIVRLVGDGQWMEQWPAGHWHWIRHPSAVWVDGGPIIEREGIEISCMGAEHGWQAAVNPDATAEWLIPWHDGPTPLVAAMRAFIASKAKTR